MIPQIKIIACNKKTWGEDSKHANQLAIELNANKIEFYDGSWNSDSRIIIHYEIEKADVI